jgi:hypothetical protein
MKTKETETKETKTSERRNFLKKVYVAPTLIFLSSISPDKANAKRNDDWCPPWGCPSMG